VNGVGYNLSFQQVLSFSANFLWDDLCGLVRKSKAIFCYKWQVVLALTSHFSFKFTYGMVMNE
jgi:hypothetical protein